MIISRLALFAINLNDIEWSSEMARWKAASKGFQIVPSPKAIRGH